MLADARRMRGFMVSARRVIGIYGLDSCSLADSRRVERCTQRRSYKRFGWGLTVTSDFGGYELNENGWLLLFMWVTRFPHRRAVS